MKNNITPVGEIIKALFEKLERKKTLTKEDIEEQWKIIAGEAVFRHSRPVSIRKGILTVFVDSSAWLQEMTLQKRKLLKQLKRIFGKDKISGIQFKIGEI